MSPQSLTVAIAAEVTSIAVSADNVTKQFERPFVFLMMLLCRAFQLYAVFH